MNQAEVSRITDAELREAIAKFDAQHPFSVSRELTEDEILHVVEAPEAERPVFEIPEGGR